MSATLRSYTAGYTTAVGPVLTFNHTVEAGDRLLLIVAAMRSSEVTSWEFAEVSFDGAAGSLIEETVSVMTNRSLWLKAYVINNPSIGAKQVRVETTISASRIGAFALSYTGSSGFGATAVGTDNDADNSINLDVSGAFSTVVVAGAGRVGNNELVWTFDAPSFLTDDFNTGTDSGNVNIGMGIAHAAVSSTGSALFGLDATNTPEIASLAVEVLSEEGWVASATMFTAAAPILTGSSMEMGVGEVTVLVGSIPPTQVLWQGNLFFSTKTRTVNVLVLTTNGSDWVQPDSGGAAQTIGVTLKRRKAYLIPQ